mmetsp:Transcript_39294/g.78510  ORF Transcript_39294/g.78510 Transcript_39294/m.78510 type:complete len:370 (-) Transcript_39294:2629-3738(-)
MSATPCCAKPMATMPRTFPRRSTSSRLHGTVWSPRQAKAASLFLEQPTTHGIWTARSFGQGEWILKCSSSCQTVRRGVASCTESCKTTSGTPRDVRLLSLMPLKASQGPIWRRSAKRRPWVLCARPKNSRWEHHCEQSWHRTLKEQSAILLAVSMTPKSGSIVNGVIGGQAVVVVAAQAVAVVEGMAAAVVETAALVVEAAALVVAEVAALVVAELVAVVKAMQVAVAALNARTVEEVATAAVALMALVVVLVFLVVVTEAVVLVAVVVMAVVVAVVGGVAVEIAVLHHKRKPPRTLSRYVPLVASMIIYSARDALLAKVCLCRSGRLGQIISSPSKTACCERWRRSARSALVGCHTPPHASSGTCRAR